MSADRFAEVERLYHEARTFRPEERASFLDRACSGDETLRKEVESLLSIPTDAGGFLSRPALDEAVRTSHQVWEAASWPTISGYTVRRVLGEGGMGVVYLAEQETPLRRLVALKLIKPGMDTRQVIARFETERQALALMDHPSIAAVFDAGSTEKGLPYFVMEFVDGVSITEYCDRERLSTRDRLALFVQVCAAVQHAHQKGVIHRDLKPSNVLVAETDGRALPKVIDFGTAKAIAGAWDATATQGGQGMVLGTLEYMSPEQAALSADIDTATDVYSLGVLLYELLVGRLPFDTEELRAAGYDEIRRVIRESDPPKPSVRAEQYRYKSGAIAQARQTDAPGLTRQLRGDLDWITLKALEKDRRRRYPTVAAMATDIGRFLDDQPVEAMPPSSSYRIRKFTRRHRGSVAAALSLFLVLVAGLVASRWQYLRAENALTESHRQRAEAYHQRIDADYARAIAEQATAESNDLRVRAVRAQTDAERERSNTISLSIELQRALQEATYSAYTSTIAAAAAELREGTVANARARLLRIPEAQRGWEWKHLFIQSDESVSSFSSAVPSCTSPLRVTPLYRTALTLDADGESILLRRCATLERWSVSTLAHTDWEAPPETAILAENSAGLVLTAQSASSGLQTGPLSYRLVLTSRSDSATPVSLGPFATEPMCADISADGAYVAFALAPATSPATAGVREEVFEVWNAATVQRNMKFVAAPPSSSSAYSRLYLCRIRFSPDGRRLATSGATVRVWDLATGAERASDSQEAGVLPQAIAFNRNGDQLAIGRPTGLVDVLNLQQSPPTLVRLSAGTGAVEESIDKGGQGFAQVEREVAALAFSPDNQTVVSGTSRTVGLWDMKQSKRVRVLSGHEADVVDVAVSADARRIFSVDTAGIVRTWLPSGAPAVLHMPGSSPNIDLLATNADGTVIANTTWDGALTTIRLADLHQEVIRAPTSDSPRIRPFVISPDGQRIFVAESDGAIRRWTVQSKEAVLASTEAKSTVFPLRISPDGTLLAFIAAGNVVVWDASTMKKLKTLELSNPMDLVFRDEETLIISTMELREPQLPIWTWSWRSNRVSASVSSRPALGPRHPVWRLALSPDGRRIALMSIFAGPPIVSIWDSNLKSEIGRLPIGDYQALAFSPDGRRIVTVGNKESVVRVWDADRLLPLLTLTDTDSHQGGVVFTRTGQIVAGRTGGGLTIWDSQIRQR